MTGHGSKLGRKLEQAVAALLTARNNEEAAKAIGVSPKTLLRRQKLPEFERAYREARMSAFRQAQAPGDGAGGRGREPSAEIRVRVLEAGTVRIRGSPPRG